MVCEYDEALVVFGDALQFGEELLDGDGRSGLFGQDVVEAVDDDEVGMFSFLEQFDFLDDIVVFEDDFQSSEVVGFYFEFLALFAQDSGKIVLVVFSRDVE